MRKPLVAAKSVLCLAGLVLAFIAAAQKDSTDTKQIEEVRVFGYRSMNGIGHFNELAAPVLYTGKKTEIIIVDSIDANKAINNTRQILGRIPGLNIVESETGGFVANGVGFRGLNPVQSLELNTRQNGYNLAADVYGYNETYYLPPMEAVERVELVKGASSLQFGAHIGGMINYVLKQSASGKPFTYSTMQTTGSDGLFNSYHDAGGTIGKFTYFTFANYRTLQGWRANSGQRQFTGFGQLQYKASPKLTVGLEYSALRNRIQMPGGLTDEQFEQDSRTSVRSRNWLKSPWNILSASLDYQFSTNTTLKLISTYLSGERSLVWFNALPDVEDKQDPTTGLYPAREIDREGMKSSATELRLMHHYQLGSLKNTLATGARFGAARFKRLEEAPGSRSSDFDLRPLGEYEEIFTFQTINMAAFVENRIALGERLSLAPGLRLEHLATEAEAEYETAGFEKEIEQEKERSFVLFGLGMQYQAGRKATLYANSTQAYRPVDYAQLLPLGTVSQVDPHLKDPKGWNSDLGVRGSVGQFFNYDASVFYLRYSNRLGLVEKKAQDGTSYTLRTNTGQSVHKGIESYWELNLTRWQQVSQRVGNLSVYHSFAYTDAQYTKGEFKGRQVEYAPALVNRIGITYNRKWLSASLQYAHQSKAYGDAANTERSTNPLVGRLPAYGVMDGSLTGGWKKLILKAGVNNITDEAYFTQRTDEYPGPGIIPSVGRSFYVAVGLQLK